MRFRICCFALLFCPLMLSLAESPKERYERINGMFRSGEDGSREAYLEVRGSLETATSVNLFYAAATALSLSKFEDAGTLFYIAQLRSRFDRDVFTAVGTGGSNPAVALNALSFQLGMSINPEMSNHPRELLASLKAAQAWRPRIIDDYYPGWDYKDSDGGDAYEKLKGYKEDIEINMGGIARLLQDADYFQAFQVFQRYNLVYDDSRPTEDEKKLAEDTMKRIEREKNLKGVFYDPSAK